MDEQLEFCEIQREYLDFQAQAKEVEALLEFELAARDRKIERQEGTIESMLQEIKLCKEKLLKQENTINELYKYIESLESQVKIAENLKKQLEIHNDLLENRVRGLDFSGKMLEEQVNQLLEDNAILKNDLELAENEKISEIIQVKDLTEHSTSITERNSVNRTQTLEFVAILSSKISCLTIIDKKIQYSTNLSHKEIFRFDNILRCDLSEYLKSYSDTNINIIYGFDNVFESISNMQGSIKSWVCKGILNDKFSPSKIRIIEISQTVNSPHTNRMLQTHYLHILEINEKIKYIVDVNETDLNACDFIEEIINYFKFQEKSNMLHSIFRCNIDKLLVVFNINYNTYHTLRLSLALRNFITDLNVPSLQNLCDYKESISSLIYLLSKYKKQAANLKQALILRESNSFSIKSALVSKQFSSSHIGFPSHTTCAHCKKNSIEVTEETLVEPPPTSFPIINSSPLNTSNHLRRHSNKENQLIFPNP